MTRFLSEALQAREPLFRQGLSKLEAANGQPNTDIRFSSEVIQATSHKLRELGLDPRDTTAEELYHALRRRVQVDDQRLIKTLRTRAATHVSADGNVVDGMLHALTGLSSHRRCFALKSSALRTLFKQQPPKKTLKRLGYRSLESFLKHETPVNALTAAWLVEGSAWQHRFIEQYKHLKASDFEARSITITKASFKRSDSIVKEVVEHSKHNVLTFKELGALVILELPDDTPSGMVTASMTLALHELNEIRACSSFLKLAQVRPNFGSLAARVITAEPELSSELLDRPMPWNLIQRYYSRLQQHVREAVFEPYLQLEDMIWQPVEHALAEIEPSLSFWQQTAHLGISQRDRPVSMNLLDSALNACNNLPFEQRIVHYFQRSLWHELLLRYMQHESVERTVMAELQPELAAETVEV